MSRPASKREALLVALFAVLLAAPWLGKAYHNDEPFFLAAGRQVLADPAHPLRFTFDWYGRTLPAEAINTTPPVVFYLAAGALKLGGESELLVRLSLLPFDVLAAVSLYLLGGLLPALVVIASPAWTLNMGHVMAEKPAMALGLFGLWAAMRSQPRWQWAGIVSLSLALLSKYIAVVFLAPAALTLRWRALLPLIPAGLWAADPAALQRALNVTTESTTGWWANVPHKLRSLLAFTGGSLAGALLWARPTRRQALQAAGLAVLVFLPLWDMAHVALVDRLTGVALTVGALCALTRMPAWLAVWAGAGLLLQAFGYWSVMTRIILFFLPPLVFALKPRHWSAVAVSAALTLALGAVDHRYAAAQKEFAQELAGRRAWHSGYMGLEWYLDDGRALSDWDLAKPGDTVAVCGINSALRKPRTPRPAQVTRRELSHPIPLRLMSGWTGEGGFYSNLSGFLPFSISSEPLETFTVVELK